MIALGFAAAHAAMVSADYCIYYNVDLSDAQYGDLFEADEHPALGVKLRIVKADSSYVDHWLDWNGADPGCKTISLETNEGPFTLKVVRTALVNGNTLEVRDGLGGNLWVTTLLPSFTPQQGYQYDRTIGPADSINILASASYAMSRSAGDVSGETFTFFPEGCPGASGSACERWPDEGIYISSGYTNNKFVIAHELGHALADAANGGLEDANNGGADLDGCAPNYSMSSHKMNSKEFSSNAFVEGFANFYAAQAFNVISYGADCEFAGGSLDWDLDGASGEAGDDPSIFSCSVGFTTTSVTIDDADFLGDYCLSTGYSNNRATEYDFLRALWDMTTYYSVSVDTIFDIWVAASPDDWHTTGHGTGSNYPSSRLSAAAYTVGGSTLQANWNWVASVDGTNR